MRSAWLAMARSGLAVLLLPGVLQSAHAATAPSLDELLARLRAVPERHARFEETKTFAVLTQPLVRRGTLDYVRPDRLRMRVESPYFEQVDVNGDELTIERRSGVTRLALSSQPALAAWIESMRATLGGDGAALQAHFNVRVEGSMAHWRIELTPRDTALGKVVARVAIEGRDGDPVRFDIDEVRGDSTVVVIMPRPVQ